MKFIHSDHRIYCVDMFALELPDFDGAVHEDFSMSGLVTFVS